MDYQTRYRDAADTTAQKYGIPPSLFAAVIENASGWNPFKVNAAGDVGLTGLSSSEARAQNVSAWNPDGNLEGGAAQLSDYYKAKGNWQDALAQFEAGPGATTTSDDNAKAAQILREANMTGDAGIQPGAAAPTGTEGSSTLFDWIAGAVKRAGVLIVALLLVAFGLWALVTKGKMTPA